MEEQKKEPKKRGRPPKKQLPPEEANSFRSVTNKPVRRPKRSEQLMNMGAEPGDNTHYLAYARVSLDLPPIDPHDPVQLKGRINDYLDYCEQNDRRPTIVGLANWIGVDRKTLTRWRQGEYTAQENASLIGKTVAIMEEVWAELMMTSKINPASGIYLSKNWFRYKDVQDVVVEPKNPLGDVEDAAELKKRIEADVVIDLDDAEWKEGGT